MTSEHQSAADEASRHLDAAVAALSVYDHPHHADRLKAIGAHVASLQGWIERLPDEEASRAEHTDRVMAAYRNRQLGATIPDHDDRALRWELERTGN